MLAFLKTPAGIASAVAGGLVLVSGGVVAYRAARKPKLIVGGVEPGAAPFTARPAEVALKKKPVLSPLTGRPVVSPLIGVPAKEKESTGIYVGPGVDITRENGFDPYYVEWSNWHTLEWGACFIEWQKDLSAVMGETDAQQKYFDAISSLIDWTIGEAPVIDWLLRNLVCFRVELPAMQLRLRNGPKLVGPTSPSGLPDSWAMHEDDYGSLVLNGWNPESSHRGFAAKFGKWPLKWPPPKGNIGGAWLKNLGDKFGVGHDVYQMIAYTYGQERSFPMMTEAGWRAVFRLGRNIAVPADNALDLFQEWKVPKQDKLSRHWTTKKKVERRYK